MRINTTCVKKCVLSFKELSYANGVLKKIINNYEESGNQLKASRSETIGQSVSKHNMKILNMLCRNKRRNSSNCIIQEIWIT